MTWRIHSSQAWIPRCSACERSLNSCCMVEISSLVSLRDCVHFSKFLAPIWIILPPVSEPTHPQQLSLRKPSLWKIAERKEPPADSLLSAASSAITRRQEPSRTSHRGNGSVRAQTKCFRYVFACSTRLTRPLRWPGIEHHT